MFTVSFVQHLKLNLKIAQLVACLPFKWDPVRERVVYVMCPIRRFICKFEAIIHLLYSITQYLFMINSPYSTTQKSIGLVFTTLYSTALGLWFNVDLSPLPMELNNALIDFESKFWKGNRPSSIQYQIDRRTFVAIKYERTVFNTVISGLIPLVLWTGIFCPIAVVLVLAKYPCAPPFLGSMLTSCRSGWEPGIAMRLVILCLEFVIFFPAVVSSAYNLCFVFFPGIFCMWDYLRIILKWYQARIMTMY